MADRPTIYLRLIQNPVPIAASADGLGGDNFNQMIKHWAGIVLLTSTDDVGSGYTLQITDAVVHVNTSGGSVTVKLLPLSQCVGKVIYVHKSHASNNLTIDADGSELINDATTLVLTSKDSWAMLTAEPAGWRAAVAGAGGGGGGGEVNTIANVGLTGIGLVEGKVGVELQVRSLTAASARMTVALDAVNKSATVDVNESALDLAAMTGIVPITKGGTGQTTANAAFGTLSPANSLGAMNSHDGAVSVAIPPNTAAIRKFLMQVGNGTMGSVPIWDVPTLPDMPAGVLRNDVDNNLGLHFLDFGEIAEPSAPAAGYSRVYRDSADGVMKRKNSAGVVVALEGGGSGAAYRAVSTSQTLTTSDRTVRATAACTLTLPSAAAFPAGETLLIQNKTVTDLLVTVQRGGTDTINGSSAAFAMSKTHRVILLRSDGVGDWIMVL